MGTDSAIGCDVETANPVAVCTELDPESKSLEAKFCRQEFHIMSWTVAINHATVTTPILYASSVLTNENGQAGNAMLYGSKLICSLFFSTLIFGVVGPKKGLTLSMGLYSVYVLLFAVAAQLCDRRNESNGACVVGNTYQLPVNLAGALIGGIGAGVLWTCQGAFFTNCCQRVAQAEHRCTSQITAELAGTFALIFLAAEAVVRASATILAKNAHLEYPIVFHIFGAVALVSTLAFQIMASSGEAPATTATAATAAAGACSKAFSAVRQWKDPKTWFLQCTNLTFGFAAAWLGGYVGRHIFTETLSSEFIGFAGAMLSALASVLSLGFGVVAKKLGKGPVLALGALAFLCLALLSRFGHPKTWGWGVLVFYVLMGIGRAVYESTNKAIFADFFPGEKSAGAFANVFVVGTNASTLAFAFGASNQDTEELVLLITFAVLTVPGYLLASLMKRREDASQAADSKDASVSSV